MYAEDIFGGAIGRTVTLTLATKIVTGVLIDIDGDTLMIHAGNGSGYPVHGCLPGDVCMVEIDATDVCEAAL